MRNFHLHSRTENVYTEEQLRNAILSAFRATNLDDVDVQLCVEFDHMMHSVELIACCIKVGVNNYCVYISRKVDKAILAVAFLDTSDL